MFLMWDETLDCCLKCEPWTLSLGGNGRKECGRRSTVSRAEDSPHVVELRSGVGFQEASHHAGHPRRGEAVPPEISLPGHSRKGAGPARGAALVNLPRDIPEGSLSETPVRRHADHVREIGRAH